MAATIIKTGSYGLATGSGQDITDYLSGLAYTPDIVAFSWNTLLSQYCVLFRNPSGNV